MNTETLDVVNIDHTPSDRCSDYDEDCADVVNPALCWVGDDFTGCADGYCPLMYGMKKARG